MEYGIEVATHFAACTSQTGMKLFTAFSAMKYYFIVEADTVNAYTQSLSLFEPIYVRVHGQYRDSYEKRFGIEMNCKIQILPFQHALQGHPESSILWDNCSLPTFPL